MGVWGAGILSNDVAEDVSLRYKDLLGENYSNEEASELVIKEIQRELDNEESAAFWLSFALIQWKLGRLQENVKNKAIEVMDSGADLERWADDPQLLKQQKANLSKLKAQLLSPQPKAKKVPKRFVAVTSLKEGDAISYELLSGDFIILRVIRIIEQSTGDRYPLFEICDWKGQDIPAIKQINELGLKHWDWNNGEKELTALAVFPSGKRDQPQKRMKLAAEGVRIELDAEESFMAMTWKEFDRKLKEFYHYN